MARRSPISRLTTVVDDRAEEESGQKNAACTMPHARRGVRDRDTDGDGGCARARDGETARRRDYEAAREMETRPRRRQGLCLPHREAAAIVELVEAHGPREYLADTLL